MKNTLVIGFLLVAMVCSVSADLSIAPTENTACCSTVTYIVKITNPDTLYQRVFNLEALSIDTNKITASLKPETIALGPGEQQDFMMIVKPDCDLQPGTYRIRVNLDCPRCNSISQTNEAVLRITGDCQVPQEETTIIIPEETETPEETGQESETPQEITTSETTEETQTLDETETPTTAVTAADGSYYNTMVIGALLVALGIFIILVARMERRATNMENKLKNVERLLEEKK